MSLSSVVDVILSRRSIRRYARASIPLEHLNLIIEAGRRAPTDATLQLWTAIRITDLDLRARIAEAIRQPHVLEASEFFIFIADLYRPMKLLEYRGYRMGRVEELLLVFAAIDAALAAENMIIAAHSLGYGSCVIGGIQSIVGELTTWLKLPEKTYPLFGLTIGIPAENPPMRPRLPIDILFHENSYRVYSEEDLERAFKSMEFQAWGDWVKVLRRYLAEGGIFEVRNNYFLRVVRERGLAQENPRRTREV